MVRISSKLLLVTLLCFGSVQSAVAKLNVFACEPEYKALMNELAPNAKVYSATTAMQDPHMIQARPSLIAKLRRADLLVCAGAELEVGWLPMLQMKAANSAVRNANTGLFFGTDHIETLDKLDKVDRSMGDVHAQGNPHIQFDPYRLLQVADALHQRLIKLDPEHQTEYQQNFANFKQRWTQAIKGWEKKAAPLKGKQVIAYHSTFRYLFNWLRIKQVGDLEPKPGLPPSSSHLASLLSLSNKEHVSAIVITSYQDSKGGQWLSKKTDIPFLQLPATVGADNTQDLFQLYDTVIVKLNGAIQ
ncbi:zinc ABC transporter substrate-binding protein [Parashewanella curva]|uniref:Zinc ABC transporter substrate-binding protein n=1 Tax=Parashewanella curva TaxID=2338552 RepID=A0A3L8Q048_9GAMM|nr:zinc ABC transporter substrate-binding protein [Parashewanella curva]RLV60935.1 zinc ABC transporter substrate-binding protein [Parashewanella curva]